MRTVQEGNQVRNLQTGILRPATTVDILADYHARQGHTVAMDNEFGEWAIVQYKGLNWLWWVGMVLIGLPFLLVGGPLWWHIFWDIISDREAHYWLRYDGVAMKGDVEVMYPDSERTNDA